MEYPALVPGVLTYEEYRHRRRHWSKDEQTVSLDAEWVSSSELYMYPSEWVNGYRDESGDWVAGATERAAKLPAKRRAAAGGCDSAMGGDNTSWAAVDDRGLIALKSLKTADTAVVPRITRQWLDEWGIPPERMWFDYGGGGKVHCDLLRSQGVMVQSVNFGATVTAPMKMRGQVDPLATRMRERGERYAYRNTRAQLYHRLRLLLDPAGPHRFALPKAIIDRGRLDGKASLRDQLKPIPLQYDAEGRIHLPPKQASGKRKGGEMTVIGLVGCSPDELEALLLAVHGLSQGASVGPQSLIMY